MNCICNNCLMTLNDKKYSFRYLENVKGMSGTELVLLSCLGNNSLDTSYLTSNFGAVIIDKERNVNLFFVPNPDMILQVEDDEFFVSFHSSDNKCVFQHLYYNKDKSKMNVKYAKKYSSVGFSDIRIKNDLVIIKDDKGIIIYNYKNNKSLELINTKVIDNKQLDDDSCLLCKIDIREIETIVFAINSKSLEFDRIYSTMQSRYIQIVEDKSISFKERVTVTLEKEVYKYLEYIEEYEEFMMSKKIDRVCKRLIKNNRV